jgi:uncharacterized protein (DUF983 family)
MKNASKLQAILEAKCPRCRQGDIFRYSNLQLGKFTDTYRYCPVCRLEYEIEPGFFIAAMYISYAMSVAMAFISGVAVYTVGNDPELWVYLLVVSLSLILLVPFMFRYSRVLLLHFFSGIKYNQHLSGNIK